MKTPLAAIDIPVWVLSPSCTLLAALDQSSIPDWYKIKALFSLMHLKMQRIPVGAWVCYISILHGSCVHFWLYSNTCDILWPPFGYMCNDCSWFPSWNINKGDQHILFGFIFWSYWIILLDKTKHDLLKKKTEHNPRTVYQKNKKSKMTK